MHCCKTAGRNHPTERENGPHCKKGWRPLVYNQLLRCHSDAWTSVCSHNSPHLFLSFILIVTEWTGPSETLLGPKARTHDTASSPYAKCKKLKVLLVVFFNCIRVLMFIRCSINLSSITAVRWNPMYKVYYWTLCYRNVTWFCRWQWRLSGN